MAQKLGEVAVESVVKLNVGGSAKNFVVVHQGLPSSLYDSSCDGTWVLMEDIYNQIQWDGSNNDYKNSDIHTYLNSTFLGFLDPDIQAVVKQVKIPYRIGNGPSSDVGSGANGLSCKIFLPSLYELGWTQNNFSDTIVKDGEKLNYFINGDSSAANQKRIAKYNGSASDWYTRSPYRSNTTGVWQVSESGNYGGIICSKLGGIRPCMILPSDLLVNDDGFVVTNEPPTAPGSIDVTGVVSGGEATITLTAATDPDGTVESYRYERQVDGGAWQQVAQVNTLTQTDHISEDWGTVAYRACAIDDLGAAGPYVTSETETINDGWTIISGPAEEMGSKPVPFDFDFSVSVSGVSSVDAFTVSAALDGEQIYSGTPSAGEQISVPIDTRLLGTGEHAIEVQASKDDYLPASKRYTFTIPAVTIPAGGTGEQAQGSDGRPVFHTTLAQRCIGTGGVDIQAQVDALTARVKILEG